MVVFADLADPEATRWFAGEWGVLITVLLAAPLIATIRHPRLGTVGGLLASLRIAEWKTLVVVLGAAYVCLGAASVAVPDHAGSWGYGKGLAAVAAATAVIAYAHRVEESGSATARSE